MAIQVSAYLQLLVGVSLTWYPSNEPDAIIDSAKAPSDCYSYMTMTELSSLPLDRLSRRYERVFPLKLLTLTGMRQPTQHGHDLCHICTADCGCCNPSSSLAKRFPYKIHV